MLHACIEQRSLPRRTDIEVRIVLASLTYESEDMQKVLHSSKNVQNSDLICVDYVKFSSLIKLKYNVGVSFESLPAPTFNSFSENISQLKYTRMNNAANTSCSCRTRVRHRT